MLALPPALQHRDFRLFWSGAARFTADGCDAVIALLVVGAIGVDRMQVVWTAPAPWVGPAFRSVIVSPSVAALTLLVISGWLVAPPAVAWWAPGGSRTIAAAGVVSVTMTALSAAVAVVPLLSLARLGEVTLGLLTLWTIAHRPRLARWLVVGFGALVVLELPVVVLQETRQSTFPYLALLYGAPDELPTSASGAAVVLTAAGGRWQRAQGLFPHPNVLGGFLALALVLGLVWFRRRSRWPWLFLAVWLVGWLDLALSFSRAALLAALLGSTVYAIGTFRHPNERRAVAALVVLAFAAGLAALALAGPVLLGWMLPGPSLLGSQSAVQRVVLDNVALTMIRLHPLLGVGAANSPLASLQPPFDALAVDPVHVVPLLVAAESGVVAGLAWLVLVIAAPYAAWRRRDLPVFWTQAAVIVTILVLSGLDHYLWTLTAGRAIFWTSLGIVVAQEHSREAAIASTLSGERPEVGVVV